MATDHEANQSIAEMPVPSSGETDASTTDTTSSEAILAETESNALSKNDDAHTEPERLEKVELGMFGFGCSSLL